MQNPMKITFHDIHSNKDVEQLIQEKYAKFQKDVSQDITKFHVVIEKLSKHHQTANSACVRLDVKISHFEDIVVSEKCSEDVESVKSTVLKVLKNGLLQARKAMERRKDHKRVPLREAFESETADVSGDE